MLMNSPQQWDDLILSTNKKEAPQNLEWTAQNLQKQLEKNREFNQSYMAQLHGCRSLSEPHSQDDQYISQPYPLSDDEEFKSDKKQYLHKLMKKYGKQMNQSTIKRQCCQTKSIDMPRQTVKSQLDNYSKEEVWQRLLEDKRIIFEQREYEKRKQLEEIVQQQCSFKPQISELASRRNTEQPVEDRLYQDCFEQKRRKERLKHDHLNTHQYSFKPEVSNISKALKGDQLLAKPLYERIDEVLKKKQDDLIRIQQQQQQSNNATYQPKISQKSQEIAEQKVSQKSVIDRLMDDAILKMQKKLNLEEQSQQQQTQECTFNPSINPTMREVQHQNQIHLNQYLMADFMREKKEKLIQELISASECHFKPIINRQSELIIESNEQRLQENAQDKITRLGQKDSEKNRMLKEQLQQIYYEQFTFKPQINEISKQIARKRSLDNLAYNPERQEKMKQLKEEQQSKQQFSYYPQLQKNEQYQHVKSKYDRKNLKQNLELEKEIKERKYQDLKKQMEYSKLKDCTFKPQTKEYNKDDELIQDKVRGLDKFFQNKENIRKQLITKEEREKNVFHYELKYDYKNHLQETKPEPFKLTQKSQNAIRQLQEEALLKERETCTFHPKINNITNNHFI